MTWQERLERVFPAPRRPIRPADVLPLVVFLAIFGGTCLYLEFSDRLMFLQPWAFLLTLVTPWVWWLHTAGYAGLNRARGMVSLMVRLTIVGLFIILIAEPRAVRTKDVLSVVYAVDVSDSVEQSTDQALQFVSETVSRKPEEDEAGLIVFARNPAVELPPRKTFPFEKYLNSRLARDATNIEQTLSLAAAMLNEEHRGRIVLISDGTETFGHMREVLDDLKSRDISVDILPIEYQYDSEVLLERLELPRYVKIGENYEAAVVLSSLAPGSGSLILEENGEEVYNKPVEFTEGKNRYTIPITLRDPGYYEYRATIRPEGDVDHLETNNTVANFIFIEGEGKVLLVYDPEDDMDRAPIVAAIQEAKRFVQEMPSVDFPRTSLALMSYDTIIFNNVPADHFDSVQLQSVHDAVYHLGVGFMMIGGRNSFGPGGYHHTPVEKALPVSMDITQKKVLPKGALVIILHTCEFPEGNTWAKRITKQAIKVLGDQDEVGAIGYDYQSGEQWIFELTLAGDYDKLVPKINGAEIGDMPNFDTTMLMGLNGLKKSDAAAKHMIIISDGDPPLPHADLLKQFKDAEVSVSTVAVFPHGGQDIVRMQAIATATKGRFYLPGDPKQLPSIFIKEAKTLKRTMIQPGKFTPQIELPEDIIDGINSTPPLYGFVLTSPKPRAHVVLKAPPKEEGEIDPVLAVWKYGLGQTVAFTSDLSTKWGVDWTSWDKYNALIQQTLVRISRPDAQGSLRIWTYASGNDGVIVVEDFHPDQSSFLDVEAALSGPDERTETVQLKQVGPRRYQASVPLWGQGQYQVLAKGVSDDGEREETVQSGLIVPYSPEYLRFESNHIALQEIAERTGGKQLTPDSSSESIYGRRAPKRSSWPVFDWFLIALVCLVPLDVGVRRVQLDWSVIKGWFGLGRRSESTATMGTLLQRKQQVETTLDVGRRESPLPTQPVPRKPTAVQRPAQPVKPESTSNAEPESSTSPPPGAETTTSRLLDLKRKRDQDDETD